MLFFQKEGTRGPLIVLLHWLSGSSDTWRDVLERLAFRGATCVAIDLPGYGRSAGNAGDDVAALADAVADTLRALRPTLPEPAGPWVVAGHSMGGKIAAILARRSLNGEPGLENLRGLFLVSPSPAGPEPMAESKRRDMIDTLGSGTNDAATDHKLAGKFIDDNTGKLPLPSPVRDQAIATTLSMRRAAFRAWFETGSREDWSPFVGVLDLPARVIAGAEDGDLGPDAQREHTLPHLADATLIELQGTGHLAPLERPAELAEHFTSFLTALNLPLTTQEQQPGAAAQALMHSDHTSPKTLEVMEARLAGSTTWNATPTTFTAGEFHTLRALAEAVVPGAGFDLAACLDRQLAEDDGDGWRFADLPEDAAAWKQGLASLDVAAQRLHGVGFLALYADAQQLVLQQAAAGKLGPGLLGTLHLGSGAHAFTAEAMQHWFEDVRSEFARLYMGDPRTMDRVHYTGYADDLGFTQIQLGQQEEFER